MVVVDVHLLAQCVLYFCGAICGLCVTSTLTVTQANFKQCMLYDDFVRVSPMLYYIQEKNKSYCHFPMYWCAFGLGFHGIVKGIFYAFAVSRSKTNPNTGKEMWVLPHLAVNFVTGILIFVVACMISVSFKQFCDDIISYGHYTSCSLAQNVPMKRMDKTVADRTTGQFYVLLNVAQVAAWSASLIWGMLIGLNVLRLIRNRRSVTAIPHTRMEETDA